jgi:hypothetical protein
LVQCHFSPTFMIMMPVPLTCSLAGIAERQLRPGFSVSREGLYRAVN